MSTRLGPDWRALAEAQKIDLSDAAQQRLEGLSRTMLGLRGLIDWTEEPVQVFQVEGPAEEPSK